MVSGMSDGQRRCHNFTQLARSTKAMADNPHQHFYPLLDTLLDQAIQEVEEDEDSKISCHKGCDHCCHLLIEVTWEEAMVLARHVTSLPSQEKQNVISRIVENASEAKTFFASRKYGKPFQAPIDDNIDIPEKLYDEYFFTKARPCPFLENKSCSAYASRPSPCRLHMVSSPSENCGRTAEDEFVEIPEAFDELRDSLEPILNAISPDGRWGHMGIMVLACLKSLGENIDIASKAKETVEGIS